MKFLKVLAQIIVIVMIITITLALIPVYAIEFSVLSTGYYAKLIDKTDLIPQVKEALLDKFKEDISDTSGEEEGGGSNEDVLPILIDPLEKAISKEWLRSELVRDIGSLTDFVKGKSPELDLEIDLTERKEILISALTEELETLPAETKEKMELEGKDLNEEAASFVEEMEIPDKISADELLENFEIFDILQSNIFIFKLIRLAYLIVLPAILVLLMLLLSLLAGFPKGLRRFGWSIGIPSLILLFGFQAGKILAGTAILNDPDFMEDIPLTADAISAAISYTANRFSLSPLLFLITGALCITIGYVLVRSKKHSKQRSDIA